MLTLHPMTNDTFELLRAVRRSVEQGWRDGFAYTKAGVMLEDLVRATERPMTLFEPDTQRRGRLMGALDEINARFGKMTAVTGTQGFKRDWQARSDRRSPAYTTQISDVPIVRC